MLEWEADGDRVVVKRAGRYTSDEIHQALFGGRKPKGRRVEELKEGIRRLVRKRHARG